MPLPQRKLIPGILLFLVLAALAAPPLWWSQGNDPVIAPAAAENNHGPANIGQAKHMAKSALEALRPILPTAAAAIEADLVGPGKPIPSWNPPANQEDIDKNHAPLLIGQLKAIADPFYRHLHAAAPAWLAAERTTNATNHPNSIFPWTAAPGDDTNKAIANIGQLKAVFSLRFDTLPPTDMDGDGLPDSWELASFGNLDQDASGDPDGDYVTNGVEFANGTNPNADTDANSNGIPDDWELANTGKFAVFPPNLSAKIPRLQTETKPFFLWNGTGAAVSYTVALSGASVPVYSHLDSRTGGVTYAWEEISATGTKLASVSNADDASEAAPFSSFSFPFFGQNYAQVFVNSNGHLSFGAGTTSYINYQLPNTSAPPNIIALLWDDLDTRDAQNSGEVYYKQESDRFIIQYQDVTRRSSTDTLSFQAVLFADGRIQIRYKTINGTTNSATVGVQNQTRDDGLGILYNAPYLVSGLALEIIPVSEFLKITPATGSVPAHSNLSLAAVFNTFRMIPGVYNAQVDVFHDAMPPSSIRIPARLEVENVLGTIALTSPAEGFSILEGKSVNFSAVATDPEGVARVEFYYGSVKFAEDLTSSYSLSRTDIPPGTHTITARMVDVFGQIVDSAPRTLHVNADSDRDGLPNDWELANGLNPNDASDAFADPDTDGYTNLEEYTRGEDPNTANLTDTDGDGIIDGIERKLIYRTSGGGWGFFNVNNPDTDE